MKKTAVWIGLTVGLLIVIFPLSILVYLIITAPRVDELTLTVEPVEQVNYNNYLCYNQVDYKGNRFAWQKTSVFNTELTLLTDSGEVSELAGVSAPFQLLEDRVLSIERGVLMQRMLDSDQAKSIADNVSSFIALEDAVLYLSDDTLMRYDWQNGNVKSLGENIYCFFIRQEQVYAVDADGQISSLEADGTWSKLCKLEIPGYPFRVMPLENCVVYEHQSQVYFVDLANGDAETVALSDHRYATNIVPFICDDTRLFVSFQATSADGSIVTEEEHPDNGVWFIDPQTREKKKLCDDAFDQLYLFEGNRLFAVRNNELFQIDIDTGLVTQISG